METTGARNAVDSSEDLKVHLYFPIPDAIILELQRRFDDKNLDLMKAFQCCDPVSTFL